MSEYMQKVKSIRGALLAIGGGESDHNLVMAVLLGLPKEYRGFCEWVEYSQNQTDF